MALGTPTSPTPIVGGNVSSITSAAFTPSANALLFASLGSRHDTSLLESSVADNVGLSWTSLLSYSYDIGSGTRMRQRLYVAPTGASPLEMQVTHSNPNTRRMMLALVEVTGTISVPTNVAGNHATNGSPAVTLSSAPLASSLLLGFYNMAAGLDLPATAPSGFTQIAQSWITGGNQNVQTCYDAGSGATTNTWSGGASNTSVGIIVEIRSPLLARARAIWTG